MFEPCATKDGLVYLQFRVFFFFLINHIFYLSFINNRYDRVAILQWFAEGHTTSPLTNKPLTNFEILPIYLIKEMIDSFLSKNGIL